MINDDLLNKIDSLEDLPVSEEMLGAYMEGKLRGSELREVQNLIDSDNIFSTFHEGITDEKPFVESFHLDSQDLSYSDVQTSNMDSFLGDFDLPFIPSSLPDQIVEVDPQLTGDIILGGDDEFHHDLHNDDFSQSNGSFANNDDSITLGNIDNTEI